MACNNTKGGYGYKPLYLAVLRPMALVLALLLFTATRPLPEAKHAVFVSVCTVSQLESNAALRIKLRIFTNDLELAIRKHHKIKNLSIKGTEAGPKLLAQIDAYLQKHLSVSLNEAQETLQIQSALSEGDSYLRATEVIFLVEGVTAVQSIQFKNTVLTDYLEGQTNIVRLKLNGAKKVFNLNARHQTARATY